MNDCQKFSKNKNKKMNDCQKTNLLFFIFLEGSEDHHFHMPKLKDSQIGARRYSLNLNKMPPTYNTTSTFTN